MPTSDFNESGEEKGQRLWSSGCDLEDAGDIRGAIAAYAEAVLLGNVEAMINLANLYDDEIFPAKPEVAVELYTRAFNLGSATAAVNLSVHYRKLGDLDLASEWSKRAVKLGGDEATEMLDEDT
jgi:TPR repeat protein